MLCFGSVSGSRSAERQAGQTEPKPMPFLAAMLIAGTIHAEVLSVRDGDTLTVKAHIWPDIEAHAVIRLRDIDAPELNAPCHSARILAQHAHERLQELAGKQVQLANLADGLYGRKVADVLDMEGNNIATQLVAEGLARPAKKRLDWC